MGRRILQERSTQPTRWQWMCERGEVLMPILGLPLTFAMLDGGLGVNLAPGWRALIWGLALMYATIVLWQPLTLPDKLPQPITRQQIVRSVVTVMVGLALAVVIQSLFHRPSSQSSAGRGSNLIFLLLTLIMGSAGVIAERTLPVNLFPVLRRRDTGRRVLYAIAAAVFLMMLLMFCHGMLIEPLAQSASQALDEAPLPEKAGLAYFDGYANPVGLFVVHLISAGFEELLFRVGVLTVVWTLTRRWKWGVLVSSIIFGLYHITLSGMSSYYLQAPIFAVLSTGGMGILNALIYRYRGFSTAVLVHAVGNWLFMALMMFA